jgi:hypothetical protein
VSKVSETGGSTGPPSMIYLLPLQSIIAFRKKP